MNIEIPFFSDNEPGVIQDNSEILKSILNSEELDAQLLQETVEHREKIILDFLDNFADADKALLQDLNRTNRELTKLVNSFKNEQQKMLVNFLRTRKAVKKYQ